MALQIAVIRNTCGPVPILVSNDDPPTHERLKAICERFEDVELDTNPERISHTGGDIAVFHKGIKFGARRGLRFVAKLSQRFIINRPRWLQDAANEALRVRFRYGVPPLPWNRELSTCERKPFY